MCTFNKNLHFLFFELFKGLTSCKYFGLMLKYVLSFLSFFRVVIKEDDVINIKSERKDDLFLCLKSELVRIPDIDVSINADSLKNLCVKLPLVLLEKIFVDFNGFEK